MQWRDGQTDGRTSTAFTALHLHPVAKAVFFGACKTSIEQRILGMMPVTGIYIT